MNQKSQNQKLTDKRLRSLQPPPQGNRIAYDGDIPGFGARITASGTVSFVLNYRRKSDGFERRTTIGQWPAWSVAAAREEAKELRRSIDNGNDPLGELEAERGAATVED